MIVQKFMGVITRPLETFQSVMNEFIEDTLKFLLAVLLLQLVIVTVLNIENLLEFYQIFINWIAGIVMIFVMTGLFHLFLMILRKGTEIVNYVKTLRVVTYASVVAVVFGWIPFFSLVSTLWFIALMVIGLSLYYKISKIRSLVIILLPYVIFLLISML